MKQTILIENGKLFGDFLSKVSVNGAIPSALLVLEDNHISANSVDAAETIFSMCSFYIGENKDLDERITIGIPQIQTIVKYLSATSQYKFTINKDMVIFTEKGKRGSLRVRTIPEADVDTALSEEVTQESLALDDRVHFEIKGDRLDELQSYLGLTGCSCIIFKAIKKKLYAMSPESDNVQFRMCMGKSNSNDLLLACYAKQVNDVLSLTKEAPVSFYLLNDEPTVIEQEGNYWGIGNVEL